MPEYALQGPENAERRKRRALNLWGFEDEGNREEVAAKVLAIYSAEAFMHTKNPMDAIESLLAAGDCGCGPPPEILRWLFDAFAQYEAGEESMDCLLGLLKRSGNDSPRDKRRVESELHPLLSELWDLVNIAEISVSHAAFMVAARFDADEASRPDTPKAYGRYSAETLRQYWYRRDIGKQVRSTELLEVSPTAVAEILNKYPMHIRPV